MYYCVGHNKLWELGLGMLAHDILIMQRGLFSYLDGLTQCLCAQ
jgi:hypothetical protein